MYGNLYGTGRFQDAFVFSDRFFSGKYFSGFLVCGRTWPGVAGVAWATFIAQGISAVLALVTLRFRLTKISCEGRPRLFDWVLLGQIAAIAVPSILQQSVLSVGNMFVQEIVNRYGSAVIAGYSGRSSSIPLPSIPSWRWEAVFPAIRPRTWGQGKGSAFRPDFTQDRLVAVCGPSICDFVCFLEGR